VQREGTTQPSSPWQILRKRWWNLRFNVGYWIGGFTAAKRGGTFEDEDPAAGLPSDLVKLLRDPTISLPQDEVLLADGRTLWEHLEAWRNAPSNTASADLPGDRRA